MLRTSRSRADEYATSPAGYVARIGDEQDVIHLEVVEARYPA